jgi:hypothetical protein
MVQEIARAASRAPVHFWLSAAKRKELSLWRMIFLSRHIAEGRSVTLPSTAVGASLETVAINMARLEISMPTRNTAGYYKWPFVWIGNEPYSAPTGSPGMEVCRQSLSCGLSVKVLQEGLFVFDFSNTEKGKFIDALNFNFDDGAEIQLYRCRVLNTHILCLHTAQMQAGGSYSSRAMVVNPSDLILFKSLDDPDPSVGDVFLQLLLEKHDNPAVAEYFSRRTDRIQLDVIGKSFKMLDRIMVRPDDYLLTLIDLYARSGLAYQDHNYSLALVGAWTITEKLLRILWNRYVHANRERIVKNKAQTFINADRRKRLTEGREFTAAIISETLSLCDQISLRDYNDVSLVRRARNDWMHSVAGIPRDSARLAMDVACRMLMHVERVDLAAIHSLVYHS